MRRPDFIFDTPAEANAFLQGVEFVNDGVIEAWINPENPCAVCVEDEDYHRDEEDIEICPQCKANGVEEGFSTCPECSNV